MKTVFLALWIIGIATLVWLLYTNLSGDKNKKEELTNVWQAPDTSSIALNANADLIRYGRDLISHTSYYLGPKGKVSSISNGMNCQNCHLDAGTKPFGNNYGSVASLYPKFRARSGRIESIEKRVNDCIQRSLNGQPLDSLSKEMKAFVAYFKWIGKDVEIGKKAEGSGLHEIQLLTREADPVKGKLMYAQQCRLCHQGNGQGMIKRDSTEYIYPPLWGDHSFNTASGLFRIFNFAKYIRANMPQGATYLKPILTEEEAWDVSAYVVSLPRPHKVFKEDWPKLETKPFDHPFGPYADSLTEHQHKYGPFAKETKK